MTSRIVGGALADVRGWFSSISSLPVLVVGDLFHPVNEVSGARVTFALGGYDRGKPARIDPVVIAESRLGPGLGETAHAIVVDGEGNAYIAGQSEPRLEGSAGAFVSRLDPTGTRVLFTTYLDGRGEQLAEALALDNDGNLYVAGTGRDGSKSRGFLARLNAHTGELLHRSELEADEAHALAVDRSGDVYVAGDLPGRNGGDVYVAKLIVTDHGFDSVYSTTLGGSGRDFARGIAVDASGGAYIVGGTTSEDFAAATLFPRGAGQEAFLARLAPDGRAEFFTASGLSAEPLTRVPAFQWIWRVMSCTVACSPMPVTR